MILRRITNYALTRKDDIYLSEATILRLARRIERERDGGKTPDKTAEQNEGFDPSCPFRFIDPKTVETIEQDANNVRSCTLSKNAYLVLKHLCKRVNCCAPIASIAEGIDIPEESVLNAARLAINPSFRQSGIALKIRRENGFIFIANVSSEEDSK